MHLSLSFIHSSTSKHYTTPPVTLQFRLKLAKCNCFYGDTVGGGHVSRVSPLCNSMHYMLSLPSVCVEHLKRRFSFPKPPFVLSGPQVSDNIRRNRPATTADPAVCACLCACVKIIHIDFPCKNTSS